MNICLAISNYPPEVGGISTFYRRLARLLADQGHAVIVLLVGYDANITEENEITIENNITKVVLKKSYHQLLNNYKSYFRPGGFEAHNWIALGLAMKNWLLNNQNKFKIEIIQTIDYGGLGFFLADDNLPPVVVFGHGCILQIAEYNYVGNNDHTAIVKKLEQLAFQKANAILTHSLINQKGLITLTGKHVSLVSVPWFQEESSRNNITQNQSILVVSGLQIFKGAVLMAETMNICFTKYPSIKIQWIGGDTTTAKNGQSVATFIKNTYPNIWQTNFLFLGEKNNSDTSLEIQKSSIIVIPALWETFNWVALEAASAGKAIIITYNTGSVYLFTHGHDAWIVPANNAEKMAEAMEYLSKNPDLCKQLGSNAKQLIETTFNNEKNAAEKIDIYQKTINQRQPQKTSFADDFLFINKYITPARKIKYKTRALLKKIKGRS